MQIQFEAISVSFQPRWANPLWDHLGCDLESERTQILQQLRMAILDTPQAPLRPLPVQVEVVTTPVHTYWHDRFLAYSRSLALAFCSRFADPAGEGGFFLAHLSCLPKQFLLSGMCLFVLATWHWGRGPTAGPTSRPALTDWPLDVAESREVPRSGDPTPVVSPSSCHSFCNVGSSEAGTPKVLTVDD